MYSVDAAAMDRTRERTRLARWVLALASAGCSGSSAPGAPEAQVPIRIDVEQAPNSPAHEAVPAPGLAVGAALTPASSDLPDVPALPLLVTVHEPPADCDPTRVVSEFGAGCVRSPVAAVRVSGDQAGVANAADGDTCTHWNSAQPPPAAISLEMAEGASVAGLVLVGESTPAEALVTHVIETSDDGELFVAAFRVGGITKTQIPSTVVFPTPIHRRHIRVRTTQSPSWIAWRDVVPFGCDGPAVPPAHATPAPVEAPVPAPPDPTPRVQLGSGRCRIDADCGANQCCQPTACVHRSKAPRCRAVGCPAVVGPLDGSTCVCHQGTCAASWPPRPPRRGR